MILQVLAGLALVGGLYEWTKGEGNKEGIQSHSGTAPDGTPVTTVVPVAPKASVTKAQANPTNHVPTSAPVQSGPPLVISPIVISPTGASSVNVSSIKDIQNALNTLGFGPLNPDNVYGPLTKNAITQYQISRGMNPDGTPSQFLRNALNNDLMILASPNSHIGQAQQVLNATVQSAAQLPLVSNKDIQHALNLLGANPSLTEDNTIGPITIAAIKAFQLIHGMKPDGIASPAVRTALMIALNNPVGPPSLMHGEHNNYHPDRPRYWLEAPFVPGTDEENAGLHFSDNRQRLLRDDNGPVPFGCEDDFDF